MVKLKYLRLVNFGGYRDTRFEFDADNQPLVLLYGPNGYGKCLSGKDLCQIRDLGMTRIDCLFNGLDLIDNTWYDREFDIAVNGRYEKVKKIYYAGEKDTVKLTTKHGYVVEGSKDLHSILSVKDGILQFVKLQDLNPCDFVAISRRGMFSSNNVCTHLARIMGYFVAEGYCKNNDYKFHNSDTEVITDFENSCKKLGLKFSTKWYDLHGVTCISSKDARYFHDIGLSFLSGEKTVPQSVMSASRESTAAFLSSYFEGDGGVDGQSVSCSSKSYELLHQIHLLLLRFGILSSLSSKTVTKLSYCDKSYESWRIFIYGEEVLKFAREIGFRSTRKKAELDELLLSMILTENNPNYDVVPIELWRAAVSKIKEFMVDNDVLFSRADYKDKSKGLYWMQNNVLDRMKLGPSLRSIKKCVSSINDRVENIGGGIAVKLNVYELMPWLEEDYFFDTVESILHGREKLYDVCVEHEHCFWSNGFISHNSTVLEAIKITANPKVFDGRVQGAELYLRPWVYDTDYIGTVDNIRLKKKNELYIHAVYDLNGKEKNVVVNNSGFMLNELPSNHNGFVFYTNADDPSNWSRFQLHEKHANTFVELAEAIYGFQCDLHSEVFDQIAEPDGKMTKHMYYQDLVMSKGSDKVHFCRMSAGEKKIATLIRQLCDPDSMLGRDIVLVDNLEMHVYFKRHPVMLKKLQQQFKGKQFIATTHSGIMVESVAKECRYDLETLRPEYRSIVNAK